MKKKIFLISLALVLVMNLVAISCAAPTPAPAPAPAPVPTPAPAPAQPPEVIKWRLQSWAGAGDTYFSIVNNIVENIATMSNGRLVIENYAGGSIVPVGDEVAALAKGSIDAIAIGAGSTIKYVAQGGAIDDTVSGLTQVQLITWFRSGEGPELARKVYDPVGIHWVGLYVAAPAEIWGHSTVPIKSAADLRGLKMRVGGECGEILDRMGMSAVILPGGEVYEAMQRGIIDICEYSSPTRNWELGLQEVADYMYISPSRSASDPNFIFTTPDAWNELTPDLRLIVQKAIWDECLKWIGDFLIMDGEAIVNFKSYGTTVEFLNPEIDEALFEEAKNFYAEKSAADPLYGEVYESKLKWKEICLASGVR